MFNYVYRREGALKSAFPVPAAINQNVAQNVRTIFNFKKVAVAFELSLTVFEPIVLQHSYCYGLISNKPNI